MVNRLRRLILLFAIALVVPGTAIAQVGFSGRWEPIQGDQSAIGPPRHLIRGGITIIETSGNVVLAPDGGEVLVYLLGPEGGEITREGQIYRYLVEVTSVPRGGHALMIKETPAGRPFGTSGTIFTSMYSSNQQGKLVVMLQKPGGPEAWWSRIDYHAAKPVSHTPSPPLENR
jgi:hypothetical protein